MLNIVSKTLMVDIENEITILDGTVKVKVFHQAYINGSDEGVHVDIELADYTDVTFVGKPATVIGVRKMLNEIDLDFDELVEEVCISLFNEESVEYLKSLYNTIKSPYTK